MKILEVCAIMLVLIQKTKMNIKRVLQSKHLMTSKNVFVALVLSVIVVGGFMLKPLVKADSVSDQIYNLQQQNASNRSAVADLQSTATSYQDALNRLQAAIAALQTQIDANTAEQNRLQSEIDKAQAELDKQKQALGEDIRQMYFDGQTTTLEMLASSKNLNEFIDKQQYQNSVQNKITETLNKVTALKHQLRSQQDQVKALLAQQQQQQQSQQASREEQSNLLAYNEGQQAAYNQQTSANQSKIDALIASQRRSNLATDGGYYFLRFPGTVGSFSPGNYPYANGGFGMSPGPGCVDNDGPDPWGYCTRQCVSYAAWAVLASGRSSSSEIRGWGNAADWVNAANARGIPIYRTPQAGDIAISTSGYWGHAMYVESVNGGNRTFSTSEYNTYLTGRLSYQTRNY